MMEMFVSTTLTVLNHFVYLVAFTIAVIILFGLMVGLINFVFMI